MPEATELLSLKKKKKRKKGKDSIRVCLIPKFTGLIMKLYCFLPC